MRAYIPIFFLLLISCNRNVVKYGVTKYKVRPDGTYKMKESIKVDTTGRQAAYDSLMNGNYKPVFKNLNNKK